MSSNLGLSRMRILVTGGAGFIASHVVDKYIELGHEVVIIDNLSNGKKENINPKAIFYKLDVTDTKIKDVFAKHKFDVVNHHAAQIDVRKSVEDPAFDEKVNVMGTKNIVENCIRFNVGKIIFASTAAVYGNPDKLPIDEKAKQEPISTYGKNKLAAERIVKSLPKYTIFRYSNVYGPRQDSHGEAGVVDVFISKMLNDEQCIIFGDGNQTRDFVYVKDIVEANVQAINKGDNKILNISTGLSTSVNELFKRLAAFSGYKGKPIYKPIREGELLKNYLNNSEAKKRLDWSPKYPLQKGLKETISWAIKIYNT